MKKIFVINPGSTSTKVALYEDACQLWQESIVHSDDDLKGFSGVFDQLDFRTDIVLKVLNDHGVNANELACIIARGGLLPAVPSGAIEVNEKMLDTLQYHPRHQHASNLGAAIAYKMVQPVGIKAYIYDPVTVDEMIDLVRITGQPGIVRIGQCHNLNMRAIAMRYCRENNRVYTDSTLIVAHLGGGITLSLQHNGRVIDMVSDDEGAFSPERSGALPSYMLAEMIEHENLNAAQTIRKLQSKGGLRAHLGTADAREVEARIAAGDERAKLVYDAMALSVARSIAKLAVVVNGAVDQIILTGGIAFSKAFTSAISERVRFIAPVTIMPGEHEMQALAEGALRVLRGEEDAMEFQL